MSRKRTRSTNSAAILDKSSSGGGGVGIKPASRDWGVAGRRGAEVEDRELRRAYPGLRLRSAYSQIVGEIPDLSPGDRDGAKRVFDRVQSAIDRGGWTTNEWSRLYRMREIWRLRASGEDRRFQLVGNRKTGISRKEQDYLDFEECVGQIRQYIQGVLKHGGGQKDGERNGD